VTTDRRPHSSRACREQGRGLAGDWDCIVIDPKRVQVESICTSEDLAAGGLHWFQVFFETGSGRCFITAGEALRLRELNTDWVKRALLNLAAQYGSSWLELALSSSPGLLLHYADAHETWESKPASVDPVLEPDHIAESNEQEAVVSHYRGDRHEINR
jgi:hypothetical protein